MPGAGDTPTQEGAPGAISVTFDNLGEAAQLELGMWPADVAQGEHFTVTEVLPRLLELLSSLELRATFFVEGLNAVTYPDALRSIAARGHELGLHAWRHEDWAGLSVEREASLLERAQRAMADIGISPVGFRPPGGRMTPRTPELLRAGGFRYVSPAGRREGVSDGLAVLPFRWSLVDAFYYMPHFSGLRQHEGFPEQPLPVARMGEAMSEAVRARAHDAGHLALLFHPFSLAFTGEEGWATMTDVLSLVGEQAASGHAKPMRMDEAARALLEADDGSRAPELSHASWPAPSD
ncbi:MAG: polysaccharide deacetylase family protein [Solirubrobacteraceae bacterium]